MRWHSYITNILESEGGSFRIYRKRLADNKRLRYTLHRLHEGVMTKLGDFETFKHAQDAALDYLEETLP